MYTLYNFGKEQKTKYMLSEVDVLQVLHTGNKLDMSTFLVVMILFPQPAAPDIIM